MKLDEKRLQEAFKQAMQMQIDAMPEETDCPEHTFSDTFEQDMHRLIDDVATGHVKQAKAPMGWQYYTRRGLAAVLVCFLLTGITMPDIVVAAYYKLIHAEERMIPEYTEYKVHSTASGNSVFLPFEIGYMPKDLKLDKDEADIDEDSLRYKFTDGKPRGEMTYFIIEQQMVTENDRMTYIVDTENAEIEMVLLGDDEEVKLIYKEESYNFVWWHGKYFITGMSDLPRDEILKILESITFRD